MTAQEFFKNDLFAENAGVVLLEVRKGYSKAKLEIKPEHLNAGARTQGGAIRPCACRSCQLARHTSFLSLVHYYFSACQRPRRYSLCRSTRTLYRSKYRLLSGRYNKPRRRVDCNF